ncbi:Hypothetical protein R9X50_00519900 [Acrodontium crateriforme]|uniref:Uncharacterized protein n=1 Tax=Acrodontium crateriforme TaxID=150365 RepID=A0AAQ3M961_9PEZI|nr:Hypothetical protein R9X50_00519900 [Acrodontium crateriforme]
MRPTSPLSTTGGFTPASHFETHLKPPSRQMHSRPTSSQRRPKNSREMLKLPGLPRFHPANFPSAHNSLQSTPEDNSNSPKPPPSPRSRQRFYSDAQQQLFNYQREMITAASRATSPNIGKPASPRLAPLGSPGPVTPLELEGDQGYLVAGVRGSVGAATSTAELVDKMIQTESRRQQPSSSPRSSN